MSLCRIVIASDIHYAGPKEKAEGEGELRIIRNPILKLLTALFRYCFWMQHPHAHNDKLLQFLSQAPEGDMCITCGDYSCGAGNIGVQYPAAFESASLSLGMLRERFGNRLVSICGDHEIGKMSLFGGKGGLRLDSWRICQEELRIRPFWHRQIGFWHLFGFSSPILVLPNAQKEILPQERERWEQLRAEYLREVEAHLNLTTPQDKLIFFCHDPTALPYLKELPTVQHLLNRNRIVLTVVGHLHTELILKTSYFLSGMPHIPFLGNSISRMSSALHRAKVWKQFNMVLCPSLAGCQLAKDGGWLELELGEDSNFTLVRHHLKW